MLSELDSFAFAAKWLPKLVLTLRESVAQRDDSIDEIADIFGNPIDLARYYVEPDCQQFNPADDVSDDDMGLVRQPIFSRLEQFIGANPATPKPHLLILADAGMGKTSVLMMLQLGYIKSFWPKNYESILLKLGNDTIENIEQIKGRRHKVLLLDALDEDPGAWGRAMGRLTQLLDKTSEFRKVIITCRTQFFSSQSDPFGRRGNVKVDHHTFPVIYMSLFSDKQVNEYVNKRFPHDSERKEKAQLLLHKMRSLRARPMLLAHIQDLIDSENTKWNEYSVYKALVTTWLQRERGKIIARTPDSPATEKALWDACQFISIILHSKGQRSLDDQDLTDLVPKNHNIRNIHLLDIKGRSLLNKNSEGKFKFAHLSIQEFFIANTIIANNTYQLSEIRVTDQLIAFILSWLSTASVEGRSSIDLKSLDLKGVNLSNSDLESIDLQSIDMRDSILTKARLRMVNMTQSNLSNVKADEVDFYGAILERVLANGASFSAALFSEANCRGCNLSNANLQRVTAQSTVYEFGKLRNADFSFSNIDSCNFRSIDGVGLILTESKLLNCDFGLAKIDSMKSTNSEFQSCNFDRASITSAVLESCIFEGSNLQNTNLSNSTLDRSKFDTVEAKGACFDGSSAVECEFIGTNLKGADLASTDLRNSGFTNTCIDGAIFTESDMTNVRFEDMQFGTADLYGACLSRTRIKNSTALRARLTKIDFSGMSGSNLKFIDSEMIDVNFNDAVLANFGFENCRIVECTFEKLKDRKGVWNKCEISNSEFNGCVIRDSRFTSCKIIASNWTEFRITNVEVTNTSFMALDMSNSWISNTIFKNCMFSEIDFKDSEFSSIQFVNCTFEDVIMDRCKLIDTDMSEVRALRLQADAIDLDDDSVIPN